MDLRFFLLFMIFIPMEATWPQFFLFYFPFHCLKRTFFIILLCLSFLILSVLSFSRTTWAAILISGIAFLVFSTRKKKISNHSCFYWDRPSYRIGFY